MTMQRTKERGAGGVAEQCVEYLARFGYGVVRSGIDDHRSVCPACGTKVQGEDNRGIPMFMAWYPQRGPTQFDFWLEIAARTSVLTQAKRNWISDARNCGELVCVSGSLDALRFWLKDHGFPGGHNGKRVMPLDGAPRGTARHDVEPK